MESCAVLGNTASSVGSTFGSMRVETASFVAIRSTKFVQNAAGSAGAVGFRNCDKVFIQDCLFDENLSLDDNGGAVLSESSNLNVSNCVFSRNVAYMNGGAVHVSLAGSVAISCCTFNGNNVSSGSGSAVWMSETAKTDILGNSLFDNCALNGGGTVYWTALLMEEPLNLTTVNNFSDTNLALYGRSVATDIFRLSLADGNIYNVTDYTMPVPLVVVHVIDFYGQIVLTESSSVAIVSVNYADALCYKSAGYVTGGIVELSSSGAYSFASLEAYCDPGYSMPVSLRTNIRGVVFQTSFRLWFRGCETGEYWGERVCAPCEEGTFSVTDPATVSSLSDLTQLDVCLGCPDGSASCHGKTVVLKDGYWRISEKATSTTACPYEGSCGGGSGAGDVLCAAGYEGKSIKASISDMLIYIPPITNISSAIIAYTLL